MAPLPGIRTPTGRPVTGVLHGDDEGQVRKATRMWRETLH